MIYYTDLPDRERFGDWRQYSPFLSGQRIRKTERLKQETDRRAGTTVFLLLRYALFREYGITEIPVFSFSGNGKPFLEENTVCFNLSHSDMAAACAVARETVGVDVQPVAPVRDGVARRVLSETEQAYLAQSDDPERIFTALWTMKESFGKYTGDGIGYEMRNTAFPHPRAEDLLYRDGFFTIVEEEKYVACAYAKSLLPVQKVTFDIILAELEKIQGANRK